ncbi:MAG TPA: hypothetical protein VMH87_14210 [Pseudomonadales bacterium]|nr:hypothetical protein [Pseudomonadales bacterium]
MEVEFNAGLSGNNPVSQSPVRRASAPPASSTMSFQYTQALEQMLKESPTVRPDAVDRAAALLSDDNYPSDETLNQVAGVLAQNLKTQPAG